MMGNIRTSLETHYVSATSPQVTAIYKVCDDGASIDLSEFWILSIALSSISNTAVWILASVSVISSAQLVELVRVSGFLRY
jgi:hypothetical protein